MEDYSFKILNDKGDQIMVALSYYDSETISYFTSDPSALSLMFYDVTLIRKEGEGYVGHKVLFAISKRLADFMETNEDAVLCFYCDADTEVLRNNNNLLPQEYRSKLFSRMFEYYIRTHKDSKFIDHIVEIDNPSAPVRKQYAHFICRQQHLKAVAKMGQILMQK